MLYQGVLRKMRTENGNPIQYFLVFENDFININQLLDKEIQIDFIKYQLTVAGNVRYTDKDFANLVFMKVQPLGIGS